MFARKNNYLVLILLVLLYFQKAGAQSLKGAPTLQTADSFFIAHDWSNAANLYKKLLKDSSTNSLEWNRLGFCNYNLGKYDEALNNYLRSSQNNPSVPLQPILYSRMAKVYAVKNNREKALENLDKAITAGYSNFSEMDTLKDFSAMKQDEKFKELRTKAYGMNFPCAVNPKAREFDFWVGEWNAYQTGTHILAGVSSIQSVSGGCMILENWTSIGAPYSGKSMNFIDVATGKWQQIWVGSEGSGQHVFINGEYRDSAMRFDFEQPVTGSAPLKGRFTFFNQGSDQVRQLNETSADGGKTWSIGYDFTYIRKKKDQ